LGVRRITLGQAVLKKKRLQGKGRSGKYKKKKEKGKEGGKGAEPQGPGGSKKCSKGVQVQNQKKENKKAKKYSSKNACVLPDTIQNQRGSVFREKNDGKLRSGREDPN